MSERLRSFLTPWRVVVALLLLMSAAIGMFRFAFGLGSVTNLSDQTPWGIWVGFDILAGIGLSAGGFIMAAAVYVFGLERYRPLLRMSILTALLGYLLFIAGLILEIGRPWNVWRCLVNHNFHSALFEIAWCVMLYTTVLLLEISRVVFERFGWQRLKGYLSKVLVPLVIIGVLLPTLHQSTLGTLFTIVPHKSHPLWYSPILPVHFFISWPTGCRRLRSEIVRETNGRSSRCDQPERGPGLRVDRRKQPTGSHLTRLAGQSLRAGTLRPRRACEGCGRLRELPPPALWRAQALL